MAGQRRLLVEGKDDMHFVIHLMKYHGVNFDAPTAPTIEDCGGYPNLREAAGPLLLKSASPTVDRVGIMIDADVDSQARWHSISERVRESGFAVPSVPEPGGWISQESQGPRICGIWMMPDNRAGGMLEDFLRLLIPDGDVVFPHAESATDEALRRGAPIPAHLRSKGVVHAWLAWQEEPGRPFGQAITQRALDPASPKASEFVAWFKRLFPS
jgi:hypothetical protein